MSWRIWLRGAPGAYRGCRALHMSHWRALVWIWRARPLSARERARNRTAACPYCEMEVWGRDARALGWAEKRHMEIRHPDVIAARLSEIDR